MNTTPAFQDEFDYSRLVHRIDPIYPPVHASAGAVDLHGLRAGVPSDVEACAHGIWGQFSIAEVALAAMSGVLAGFLDQLAKAELTVHTVDEQILVHFATTNPAGSRAPTDEEVRLRVNVINAIYLALEDAQVIKPASPLILPSTTTKTAARAHVRCATHDEVLLTRLATRRIKTQRAQHLAAACVAICSNGATCAEAPQVLWSQHVHNGVRLPGRTSSNNRAGMDIAARTISFDAWSMTATQAWKTECSTPRPVHDDASMLYTGHQELTSNSAAVSTDQQVKKALKIAGLAQTPGLTAGSLRLWSMMKDVTDLTSANAAARRGGISFLTLHTKAQSLLDLAGV